MKPIIELTNLSFGYETRLILENINFHLHPGQFAALVGPSGAGKTSLLRLILNLTQPTHGNIYRQPNTPIAYVPQLETVDWNFPVTAEEVVFMGLTQQTGWLPWYRPAHRQKVEQVMEQLDIAHLAKRHIRDLSGGQQQRFFLARALVANPQLLILDEPTTGVDMRSAENIFHLLAELNQQGMTILLTTHDLNMAAAHIPWVVCLNKTIIAQGSPYQVFTEPILSQAYQGDMLVIRQNNSIFIQQKPHHHTLPDILPQPIPGGLPGHHNTP